MSASLGRRLTAPLISVLGTLGVMAALGAALTSAARAAVPVAPYSHGGRAQIQPAQSLPSTDTVGAPVASTTPVSATVALTPSDPSALAAYANAVATPGSGDYHDYLSVAQFAARFGASPAEQLVVRADFAADHLSVGVTAPDGLSLTVSGSASQVESAFSTTLDHVTLADGAGAYADAAAPSLPSTVASAVSGVAGLSSVPAAAPAGLAADPTPGADSASGQAPATNLLTGAGPGTCAQATSGNGPEQIGSAYGMWQLWQDGDLGAGTTVALFELSPFTGSDISEYQSCFGTDATVTTTEVDGGTSTGMQQYSDEPTLDIEDVAGLAPQAAISVFEGPDTAQGAYDTYQAIADSGAQVVSTSWGECEALSGSSPAAESAIFEQSAIEGQTVFAAAGDAGSACRRGARTPEVDDPASQPYVTGVGGTHLGSFAAPQTESVWNNSSGAGGGGVSSDWTQPGYQTGRVLSQSSISCGASTSCREVPDVSADADPETGYAVYYDGAWAEYGGTSAAAPTWAALTALADGSAACAGTTVGFANPTLYSLPSSDFYDVTSGSNAFDGVAGYSAQSGYDMASGLGAPNGVALAPALCEGAQSSGNGSAGSGTGTQTTATTATTATTTTPSPAPTTTTTAAPVTPAPTTTTTTSITTSVTTTESGATTTRRSSGAAAAVEFVAPARRSGRVGQHVSQPLSAFDRDGLKLRYTAIRLPPGLSIDAATGTVSGMPRRSGGFRTSITATDSGANSTTVVIVWTIARRAAPPKRRRDTRRAR